MLLPLQRSSAVLSITMRSHPTPLTELCHPGSPSSTAEASRARRSGSRTRSGSSETGAHSGRSDHSTDPHAVYGY
jgi:hypothetical protein